MSALLAATGLAKRYPTRHGLLHAVDGVDLEIGRGESVGLVGESGCGKSTLVRLLARLIAPTEGAIVFDGQDIAPIPLGRFVHSPQRARIQSVFQDPTESLNPALSVFGAVADPIRRLGRPGNSAELARQVHDALSLVGLPAEMAGRLPHQLSGGQRARVGIARAVALRPDLLILDEPTSALDVSVQAVVLRLLADLRQRLGMSYLFVSQTSTWSGCCATASRSCTWAASSSRRRRPRCSATPATPTRWRCWPRSPTRPAVAGAPGGWKDRLAARSTRRPPTAASPAAARRSSRCARKRCRSYAPSAPGTSLPATSPRP